MKNKCFIGRLDACTAVFSFVSFVALVSSFRISPVFKVLLTYPCVTVPVYMLM